MIAAPFTRRTLTAVAVAAAAALAACGSGGDAPAKGDMAMGAAEGAPVTVVEYASVTCTACAAWNEQVWPEFRTKYVDTSKVRYVFREFPTPPQDVAVAGFLIARCAGEDKYFDVVDQIMRSQAEWRTGTPPRATLQRVATAAGLSERQFQACVTDPEAIAAMEARISEATAAGVGGTPTFLVNGQRIADPSLSGLSAAIDPLLAK